MNPPWSLGTAAVLDSMVLVASSIDATTYGEKELADSLGR
jgi:hypothetical protein